MLFAKKFVVELPKFVELTFLKMIGLFYAKIRVKKKWWNGDNIFVFLSFRVMSNARFL